MSEREKQFETMLEGILKNYHDVVEQLSQLQSEDKVKTATFRQLTARKLKYQDLLALYKLYGLIEAF